MTIDDDGRRRGSPRPRVSIVIPAWNEQDYLGECLEAIAAQTDPPDEVIVVDNGSTDATGRIAASYPFVTVLEEPIPGIVPARNRGLNAATGDVLGRIDADSIIDPGWVAVVRAHFTRAGTDEVAGITGSGDALIDGHPALGHLLGKATLEYGYYPISEILTGGQVMVGCNMAITRTAWETIREDAFPDHTKVHEDLDLSVLIHRAGGHIHHLPEMRIRTRRVELEPPAKLWWRLRIWPNAVTRHQHAVRVDAMSEKHGQPERTGAAGSDHTIA
ncbi:glycosyltransferase [Leifsonia sp. H3M29-4]|jgi:glycosyltransferase involved in cell wall biosynthesis|uniref:glycosyltransferase n=1 Tax=Microbacteriaceae TaxID=85023 RepID=UPI000C98D08F|nr:glycosyltransferase family 2 protein [Salinibacterium metalliresistens]MAT83257.1 hypothetical protein [Gammaproteobacteria bacterium]MDF1477899.1 glycosyltransferase [Salinibacterium metalliresistens]